MTEAKNGLVVKLAAIMGDIGTIPKNGSLDLGNRKVPYVAEYDLLEAVRSKLAAAGVMFFTSDEDVQTEQLTRTNARGESRQAMMVTLRTKYTLIDGESGCEFSFYGSGQGEDSGDKALYKAKTGALKYAIRETFLIPTGDDPEKDASPKEPRQRAAVPVPPQLPSVTPGRDSGGSLPYKDQSVSNCTNEGRGWFWAKAKELGFDRDGMHAALGVKSIKDDMPDATFEQMLAWAEKHKLAAG